MQRAGLSSVGHVSLDATKIQANASKHKEAAAARARRERHHAEQLSLGARDHDDDDQPSAGATTMPAYNAQAAVSDAHIIVAHGVSNQGPDQQHLYRCSSV